MGNNKSSLRPTTSVASMLGESVSTHSKPRSIHEGLVRERDQKHDFDTIYEVLDDIGRGGLCRVYKIRKKDDKVGGSSRPEHVRRRSSIFRGHRRFPSSTSEASLLKKGDSFYEGNPSLLYALKTINLKLVPKDKIEQLQAEVECLKTLDHKNIIKAYETFVPRNSGKLMIVMELCTGGDLFSRIPYSENQVANVMRQILSAVAYMHDRNVIHRDIKMENIVFESKHPESPIKVIDFGLSRKYAAKGDVLVERVGTLYSMSPETMKGAYDEKADLWSIGVCCYIMLARGDRPFDGKTPKELVAKILEGKFSFEGELWDNVTDQAKLFISDLLATNRSLRPTARQAHVHPWINECSRHGSASETESVDDDFRQRVRECIARYAYNGPLRKLALNVIAKRSTADEIYELRKMFDEFDVQDTGTITYEQFKEALAHSKFSDEEMERIFRSVDLNQNNVINYTEFLAACLEAQGDLAEYRLAEAFDVMDSDDSGYISRENLRVILGEHADEKFIDQLIAEADFKKDGRISYEEFLHLFSRQSQKRVSEIYPAIPDTEAEAVLKKHGFLGSIVESLRRNTSSDMLWKPSSSKPFRKNSEETVSRKNSHDSGSTGSRVEHSPFRLRTRKVSKGSLGHESSSGGSSDVSQHNGTQRIQSPRDAVRKYTTQNDHSKHVDIPVTMLDGNWAAESLRDEVNMKVDSGDGSEGTPDAGSHQRENLHPDPMEAPRD